MLAPLSFVSVTFTFNFKTFVRYTAGFSSAPDGRNSDRPPCIQTTVEQKTKRIVVVQHSK